VAHRLRRENAAGGPQTVGLHNERNEIDMRRRQMAASVLRLPMEAQLNG
jgi:hypothetical protein